MKQLIFILVLILANLQVFAQSLTETSFELEPVYSQYAEHRVLPGIIYGDRVTHYKLRFCYSVPTRLDRPPLARVTHVDSIGNFTEITSMNLLLDAPFPYITQDTGCFVLDVKQDHLSYGLGHRGNYIGIPQTGGVEFTGENRLHFYPYGMANEAELVSMIIPAFSLYPTCDDGIMNGDETGIDCGGKNCRICPTCDDGIKNGDETGVDCGSTNCGPCPQVCGLNIDSWEIQNENCYTGEFDLQICYSWADATPINGNKNIYLSIKNAYEHRSLILNNNVAYGSAGSSCETVSITGSPNNYTFASSVAPANFGSFTTYFGGFEEVGTSFNLSFSNACSTSDIVYSTGIRPTDHDGIQNGDETGIDCYDSFPLYQCIQPRVISHEILNYTNNSTEEFFELRICYQEDIEQESHIVFNIYDIHGNRFHEEPTYASNHVLMGARDGLWLNEAQTLGDTLCSNVYIWRLSDRYIIGARENIVHEDIESVDHAYSKFGSVNEYGNSFSISYGGIDFAWMPKRKFTYSTGVPGCNKDGIQNGDETGIDCGGTSCDACPNCNDGIWNGDETGVDCGGTDCEPCPTCNEKSLFLHLNFNHYVSEAYWEIIDEDGNSIPSPHTSENPYINNMPHEKPVYELCVPYGCTEIIMHTLLDKASCCSSEDEQQGTGCCVSFEGGGNFALATDANGWLYKTQIISNISMSNICQSSCYDLIMNGDETGIDCGGSCPGVCATCDDGIWNGDERGIDCGGSFCNPCSTCTNGIEDEFETGIDCGGPCNPCDNCQDGIMNGLETGIDCGGPDCIASCPTCNDGILNQDETSIDCGGICNSCPSCDDGIKNQDETEIDCGGTTCDTCITCNDGILNQDETAIDCGGTTCDACPTCSDGIKNQDETAVDCGGTVCDACESCALSIDSWEIQNANCSTNEFDLYICYSWSNASPIPGYGSKNIYLNIGNNYGYGYILIDNNVALGSTGSNCQTISVTENEGNYTFTNPTAPYYFDSYTTYFGGFHERDLFFNLNFSDNCQTSNIIYSTGYKPTCYDNIQNGNETEVDCGGDCPSCDSCVEITDFERINVNTSTGEFDLILDYDTSTDVNFRIYDINGNQSEALSLTPLYHSNPYNTINVTKTSEGYKFAHGDPSNFIVQNFGGVTERSMSFKLIALDNSSNELDCHKPSTIYSIGKPPACDDEVMNGDETGVDCGGTCPVICITCDDGILNQDETSIDCGGTICDACPTCEDGIKNQDETGIDCGGAICDACPTCEDGIENQDETSVDCGGAICDACPTCEDGIKNQDETSVDCGGAICDACPTCEDGIKNQDETGIDCGGTMCEPCSCNDNRFFLHLNFNEFVFEAYWEIRDEDNNIIPSSYTSQTPYIHNGDETLSDEYCVPNSCYETVIHIVPNYGSCCDYDIGIFDCCYTDFGSYTITNGYGTTIDSGVFFESINEFNTICVSTCYDGIHNGDETEIDCGGATCDVCPTCDDGIRNGYEMDVDCGGPFCDPCTYCNDGSMNGDETGIDCGGSCSAICPTCDDGIMNGDETGIDCGGSTCNTCLCSSNKVTLETNFFNFGSSYGNELNIRWEIAEVETALHEDGFYYDAAGNLVASGIDNFVEILFPNGYYYTNNFATNEVCLSNGCYIINVNALDANGNVSDCCLGGYEDCCLDMLGGIQISNVNGNPLYLYDTYSSSHISFQFCLSGPTCDDGILNGDETSIDCGSFCPVVCPTCEDGIKNQDETGIDCGGTICDVCPTCEDGIKNQDETNRPVTL